MELQTAIEILTYHQEWRLGKRDDMIHEPRKLTEAIDILLTEVKKLNIASVVRGAVTSHCLSLKDECEFTNTCPECTKPATEPLPAEGEEKPCADGHWFATEYMGQRPAICIVCGHMEI